MELFFSPIYQRGHERISRYLSKMSRSAASLPSILAGPADVEGRLSKKNVQRTGEATVPSPSLSVTEFLKQADVEKYSALFEERKIVTMEELLRLTDNDLKDIGLKLMGPRRKLTSAIARHRKKDGCGTTSV